MPCNLVRHFQSARERPRRSRAQIYASGSPFRRIIRDALLAYDTILDASLTCNQQPARVSLIYRTKPTTKKWENRKTKKVQDGYAQKYR